MAKYIEKFRTFGQIIKQNGGWVQSYLKLYRTDELKLGTLVGTDKYGNKYFENKSYMVGRSRWVEYSDAVGMDYDGSQVPAEWHQWLHYTRDYTPVSEPPLHRDWMAEHIENKTGTAQEYVPYSTTRPKIEAWQPNQK